jgi:hypothetical protein
MTTRTTLKRIERLERGSSKFDFETLRYKHPSELTSDELDYVICQFASRTVDQARAEIASGRPIDRLIAEAFGSDHEEVFFPPLWTEITASEFDPQRFLAAVYVRADTQLDRKRNADRTTH